MAEEPVPGQPGNGVESTRLLEQVSGAGHHGQVVLAAQLRLGPAVEIQHHLVAPADDQQRRRGHPAPRQAEHHDRLAAQVPQPGGEPTPGIITISEHHDSPSREACSPPGRSRQGPWSGIDCLRLYRFARP